MIRPVIAFVIVGAAGLAVQMSVLMALSAGLNWPPALATAVAVEAAVLANFFWHERWTWAHRDPDRRFRLNRLGRFHLASGVTSILGNVVVATICVEHLGMTVFAGNLVAVALLGLTNFTAADRWVFAARVALVGLLLAGVPPAAAHAAEPSRTTLAAWNAHVARVESSLSQHEQDPPLREPQGLNIDVPGGTIYEWRGSVRIEDATLGDVVDRLIFTAGEAVEDGIVDARVLNRQADQLRVYLRLERTVVVTATYDTEHDVLYVRRSPQFATSRSVSTKIAEAGGGDRGFLWRLNSYWRYRQMGKAVQVDILSLSLSRDVPWMIKRIAEPIIGRIGRESMERALAATERRAASRHVKRRGSPLRVDQGAGASSEAQGRPGARTATPAASSPDRTRAAR